MNANPYGLLDEATLARLANELFAGAAGRAGQHPAGSARRRRRPRRPAGPPPRRRQAAPAATVLSEVPDSLDESGMTVHAPPHREAVPGWDSLRPPSVPAGFRGY